MNLLLSLILIVSTEIFASNKCKSSLEKLKDYKQHILQIKSHLKKNNILYTNSKFCKNCIQISPSTNSKLGKKAKILQKLNFKLIYSPIDLMQMKNAEAYTDREKLAVYMSHQTIQNFQVASLNHEIGHAKLFYDFLNGKESIFHGNTQSINNKISSEVYGNIFEYEELPLIKQEIAELSNKNPNNKERIKYLNFIYKGLKKNITKSNAEIRKLINNFKNPTIFKDHTMTDEKETISKFFKTKRGIIELTFAPHPFHNMGKDILYIHIYTKNFVTTLYSQNLETSNKRITKKIFKDVKNKIRNGLKELSVLISNDLL